MFITLAVGTLLVILFGAFLAYRKRYRGLALGLSLGVLTILIGLWAIFQSRSSTAAIGILFLPFYAIFSGGMAWLYRNLMQAEHKLLRGLGWPCLALALAVPGGLVYSGFETIALNRSRDAQHQANLAEIERNRQSIKASLASNPGRETEVIENLIGEHLGQRTFILPLLESRFVTPASVDRLANSDDLGIALSALRHPACPSATLARIYRMHSYPDYFFQAIASHPNTPPDILVDLYRRPVTIMGLDRSFARNPATPRDILLEIATATKESFVVQQLLQNPKFDCTLLAPIEAALQRTERPTDSYSLSRLAELRGGPCGIRTH
ncbi:hypothetical protein [Dechloromonas sp. HYN0024]|uniref:hypothetical protein n=1 Tax=Dechloromonas sp. HYN0024 TaxID=2231055 RepID=UPI000E440C36|nr:hypothetical protein [Dechloromonas sp. HYN0024]AXS80011.1 hypothetical protein HYN24_08250 [Dechloromonas sp. HYN0024]